MVLLIILLLIAVILTIVAVAVLSIGGAIGLILFSDIIVCVAVIVWIIKKCIRKK